MPTYNTISGQSPFDVCIQTTGDFSNLFDVVRQFGNLNSDVAIGAKVDYTVPKVVKSLVVPIPITNPQTTTYYTASLQTVFDLAVQFYGDVSRIDQVLKNFTNLPQSLDFKLPVTYTPNDNPITKAFTRPLCTGFIQGSVLASDDLTFTLTSDDGTQILTP